MREVCDFSPTRMMTMTKHTDNARYLYVVQYTNDGNTDRVLNMEFWATSPADAGEQFDYLTKLWGSTPTMLRVMRKIGDDRVTLQSGQVVSEEIYAALKQSEDLEEAVEGMKCFIVAAGQYEPEMEGDEYSVDWKFISDYLTFPQALAVYQSAADYQIARIECQGYVLLENSRWKGEQIVDPKDPMQWDVRWCIRGGSTILSRVVTCFRAETEEEARQEWNKKFGELSGAQILAVQRTINPK
jgi:hypothetical protein